MNSKKYWESRSAQRELEAQLIASKHLAKMEEQLRLAQSAIIKEIETFYSRYAVDNQITYAEAKKYLTAKELKDFRNVSLKEFRKMSLSGNRDYDRILNALGFRARISRLEMLHLQIEMQMIELYGSTTGLSKYVYTGLAEVYENAYYKTLYDVATLSATYTPVKKISDDVMKEVLSYNWSGKEFSKRIWGHEQQTMQRIRKELEISFKQGRSLHKTAKAISEATDTVLSRAENLVRTEANFFHNLAAKNSYDDADIDRYQILATLDHRTSEICREQDMEIYFTKDYKPGLTAPPFHSRCRSTTIPYFDEEEYMQNEKRISSVGTVKRMSYEEWEEKYVTKESGD